MLTQPTRLLRGALIVLIPCLMACSSDSEGVIDGAPSTDVSVSLINADGSCRVGYAGCTTFTDLRGKTAVDVRFGGDIGEGYSPKCLRVDVGTELIFKGNFPEHPLSGACQPVGAAALPATEFGRKIVVEMKARGHFGFYCTEHGFRPEGAEMAGAIIVE